jgi:hypothetical protein
MAIISSVAISSSVAINSGSGNQFQATESIRAEDNSSIGTFQARESIQAVATSSRSGNQIQIVAINSGMVIN